MQHQSDSFKHAINFQCCKKKWKIKLPTNFAHFSVLYILLNSNYNSFTPSIKLFVWHNEKNINQAVNMRSTFILLKKHIRGMFVQHIKFDLGILANIMFLACNWNLKYFIIEGILMKIFDNLCAFGNWVYLECISQMIEPIFILRNFQKSFFWPSNFLKQI